MRPVAEWPETNLEYHKWYNGDAAFKDCVRAGKLIRGKPVGEIWFFFVTRYWKAAW